MIDLERREMCCQYEDIKSLGMNIGMLKLNRSYVPTFQITVLSLRAPLILPFLKDIGIHSYFVHAFSPKALYFMNKYEPIRW